MKKSQKYKFNYINTFRKNSKNLNLLKQFTKNIDKYTDKCQLANTKTQR